MPMHVIFPGPRTTIQDKGRLGYQNSGFAPSGFMDRVASRMANVLVDNDESEAVVEFCLVGPILRFDEEVDLAVCGGDFGIDVNGRHHPANKAVHVPAGSTVRITTGRVGLYGSLAIGGGLDIPVVMGSRSTNLRCGIGGHKGRILMGGDVIGLRDPGNGERDLSWRWVPERRLVAPEDPGITKVRVIPGPQDDMFTEKGIRTFYESSYVINSHSDRMGYRLNGPPVEAVGGYDILTDGIVNGSVQISGTGEPIVMMADRQTTGGYAKIASVINVDIPLFAQLRPGQKVQFEKCTMQEAQRLIREAAHAWEEHCRKLQESDPYILDMEDEPEDIPVSFAAGRDAGPARSPGRTGGWKTRQPGNGWEESRRSLRRNFRRY